MTDPLSRLRRFLAELKRRKVYRVAVAYLVVGFAVLEGADIVFPRLGLPSWSVTLVIGLVGVGFPLAVVLAWAFDLTAEGVERASSSDEAGDGPPQTEGKPPIGGLAAGGLVTLGLVAAVAAGGWYLLGASNGDVGGDAGPADRSIAVLPFAALSSGEEARTFARGIHDDLLTKLFNVSGLTVISRTAVEKYRDTELTTGQIADSLGVRWVMEGGVEILGDEIQVNAQLIDPRTETHAWADSYRRELTVESLFALQSDITKRIARSMEAELTSDETERIERRPTDDLGAYRLYVRGRDLLDRRTPAAIDSARAYFDRALRRDSTYALAWVGWADARMLHPAYSGYGGLVWRARVAEALPETEASVRRALELNPELADAHASLGLVYYFEQLVEPAPKNGPRALRTLHRALELKPSYAPAHGWLATWQLALGHPRVALEHFSTATALKPGNYATRRLLGGALLSNGRYEEALGEGRRLRQLYPERTAGPALEAGALVHLKRWDDVRKVVQRAIDDAGEGPPPSWAVTYRALADLEAGDTAAARNALDQLDARRDPRPTFAMALIHSALGEDDAALSTLEMELPGRGGGPAIHVRPRSGLQGLRYLYPDILGTLRQDPAYRKLLREVNVAWGLNPDGSLPDGVATALHADVAGGRMAADD